MMYQKAVYFGDEAIADKILHTEDVAAIKELGRCVSGYDESYWNGIRQIVVFEGLYAKFSQNEELKFWNMDSKESKNPSQNNS